MGIIDQRLKSALDSFSRWNPNFKSSRPPGEKYYGFFIAALIAWMLADLVIMSYRPSMLPSEAPPIQTRGRAMKITQIQDYNSITDRNLFAEDGKIPPPLSADKNAPADESAPVLSSLPLTLVGTIVHFNPNMSIATIQSNSGSQILSFGLEESVFGMAEVKKIERKRVIFLNSNSRRLEYIEIKDEDAFNLAVKAPNVGAVEGIQKVGEFDFAIKRSDLTGLTSNLSAILQQARMEPRIGPDGSVDGFCFSNIQPGTPYEKFGFKIGDCIKSVNGDPINSPGKAMELYNQLRESSFVQLGVERDGRDEKFNYSIR
jgi:general secretion pathway protein C